jgi:hypothetical protein
MTESNTASVLANALRERASGAAAAPPLTALYAQAEGSEHADGPPGEQLGAFDLGVVPIDALAHRRPRRAAVAVAAAALVAAAVAAAVVGSGAFGGPRHPGAVPAANSAADSAANSADPVAPVAPAVSNGPASAVNVPLKFAADIATLPAGLRPFTTYTQGAWQQLTVASAANEAAASIVVNGVGWHPAVPAGASAVTINGQSGYFAANFDVSNAPAAGDLPPATVAGIVWQSASGPWVFVYHGGAGKPEANPLSQPQLVALADAVSVGSTSSVKSPVKLGYLPAGAQLDSFSSINEPSGVVDTRLDISSTVAGVAAYTIELQPGTQLSGPGPKPGQSAQPGTILVNGFIGSYDAQVWTLMLSNGALSIEISANGPIGRSLTPEDVTKVVAALTVAPKLGNTSTWFPIADATPNS